MKSQIVTQNATTGALDTPTASTGFGIITDGVKSALSLNTAAFGWPKAVELGLMFLAGNVAGVQSTTGKIGVGILGKNYLMGE